MGGGWVNHLTWGRIALVTALGWSLVSSSLAQTPLPQWRPKVVMKDPAAGAIAVRHIAPVMARQPAPEAGDRSAVGGNGESVREAVGRHRTLPWLKGDKR